MRVELMRLSNYGPYYGDHAFAWNDRGLTIVLGDNRDEPRMNSNGSGKSALSDALDWCLFGEVPRQDHVDSVVNDVAARESKGCSVTISLRDDDDSVIKIVRSRGKRKTNLTVSVDGEDKTTLDIKETQKIVEQLLGLDRKIFHAAVLFSQTDLVRYADSSDTDRMRILSRILQLEKLDEYLVWMKAKRAKTDTALNGARRSKATLSVKAANLTSTITVIQSKAETFEVKRSKDLADIRAEKDALTVRMNKFLATSADYDINRLNSELARYEKDLAGLSPPDSHPKELEDNLIKQSELNTLLGSLGAQQAILTGRLEKFDGGLGDTCTTCEQPITGDWAASQRIAVRRELDAVVKQVELARSAQAAAQAEVGNLHATIRTAQADFTSNVNRLQAKISDVRVKLATCANREAELDQMQRTSLNLTTKLESVRVEPNPFMSLIKDTQSSLVKVNSKFSSADDMITIFERELAILDFWITGFGPKGLKSYILDARLGELTDAANEWMQILTGGTMWVKFDSQKRTRSGKAVNAPHLIICKRNIDGTVSERNYNSWSGGQKRRIAFCVDFGLTRLLARRATKSYDLIILDEVFRHLDALGKEAAVEMLEILAQEKNSIFAIEHDSEFSSRFTNIVKVVHENTRSRIENTSKKVCV